MEMRGIMGGFYRISEWIMRLAAINLLWLICSIPFFFFLLSMMMTPDLNRDQVLSLIWTMALVMPFTLVPASTAMFSVARKWVMGDEDVPLFKTYFRSYKDNYKQSMLGGLVFMLIGVVLVVNMYFYSGRTDGLHYLSLLFISFTVVYVAAFVQFLCLTVHFNMKLLHLLRNAFIMTLGQPIMSIGILLANGIILYISLTKFTFLIPFFMGSLCAYASFWLFYRSFQRIQDKAEKAREQSENNEAEPVHTKD